jgi:hypothetical protein
MYMDNSLGQSLAEDIYESNLKLWKVFSIGLSRGDNFAPRESCGMA